MYRNIVWSFMWGALAVSVLGLVATPVGAQSLTKATRDVLKELKIPASMMKGLDKELAVSKSIMDGAKKEGMVKVRLTMTERNFLKVQKLWNARYPDVKVEYTRGVGQKRALQPLLGFKRKSYVTDVVSSYEEMEDQYRKADALLDLRGLPAYGPSVPTAYSATDGTGAAYSLRHWCIAYGTNVVKKADLPKTWNEIVTNPRWGNGNLGITINSSTWFAPLWGFYGEKWGLDYMDKLFGKMKPQLRKERLNMTPQLASLGEYQLTMPGGDFIVKVLQKRGVPVAFYCPEPVPTTTGYVGVFKGGPRSTAGLLFANWLLSKEGQIAVHYADFMIPTHKELRDKRFLPYPDEILGKKRAWRTQKVVKAMPTIVGKWREYWVKGGGTSGKRGGKKRRPR